MIPFFDGDGVGMEMEWRWSGDGDGVGMDWWAGWLEGRGLRDMLWYHGGVDV
jgi:hypothetical protein